jgi:trans-feruloyl-CoA hydratase/vanillin synthase
LRDETLAISRRIAQKSPFALKAAKETYRHSLEMSWDAAINYATAKEHELAAAQAQAEASREAGIGDFLDGQYRPGLESHPARGKGDKD